MFLYEIFARLFALNVCIYLMDISWQCARRNNAVKSIEQFLFEFDSMQHFNLFIYLFIYYINRVSQ